MENGSLSIQFDQGEVVEVLQPKEIISESDRFYIKDASFIKFSWYSYGHEHIEENKNYIEYSNHNGKVIKKDRNGSITTLSKHSYFAMEIV